MKTNPKHKPKTPFLTFENIPEAKRNFPIPENELEMLKERNNEKLLFSFKFFDRSKDEFNLGNTIKVCENWFISLLDILKDVSNLTRNELVGERRQFYDAHNHDWDKLKLKFPLDEMFLDQVECLQFRLSKSKGRDHGIIVRNRFYIIWLDPHHNLYPDEKFGGTKYYERPLTCYEMLESEVLELNDKIGILEKDNSDLWEMLEENHTKPQE